LNKLSEKRSKSQVTLQHSTSLMHVRINQCTSFFMRGVQLKATWMQIIKLKLTRSIVK